MFKKLTLEMGGKNPTIVFADADLDEAIPASSAPPSPTRARSVSAARGSWWRQSVYERVLSSDSSHGARALGSAIRSTRDRASAPWCRPAHRDKIESYIALAQRGGRDDPDRRAGGPRRLPERCRDGFFLEPTVITGLPMDCRANQEEIFGPVVTVTPFRDEDEAIALANDSRVRPRGVALDPRPRRGPIGWPSGSMRHGLGQLLAPARPAGAVRRDEAERRGPGGRREAIRFFTEAKNCVLLQG